MTVGPPKNLRSLEARLRNLARDEQQVEGRVRRALSVAIVGEMLATSDAGVIKGATNLELRLGTQRTRASSDLDAVRRVGLENFRTAMETALSSGWEGFTGRLVDRGEILAPVPDPYRPHRFHAKLDYRHKPFGTVEIEVAAEEINALQHIETIPVEPSIRQWFETLGLPAPTAIPVLALTHQIAQKLHACTIPDADGWVNDRSHDLVDLQLAIELFGEELAEVRAVAYRLFAARARHLWPPEVTVREGWATRYQDEAGGLDVLDNVDAAVRWANELIARIDAATTP